MLLRGKLIVVENVDRTHLVLASTQIKVYIVLQKLYFKNTRIVLNLLKKKNTLNVNF